MSHFLNWPGDFDDPTPATPFDEELFVSFLDDMTASGATVYADSGWALFGFERDARMVDFVRRGRSHKVDGRLIANREMIWEVWPRHGGEIHRLGPVFAIREHACIVVAGLDAIRKLSSSWLDGQDIETVANGVTFWDRMDTSKPLTAHT